MKRGISGAHHNVSAKYLQSYLDEYTFRYNNRGATGRGMFDAFLSRVEKVHEDRRLMAQSARRLQKALSAGGPGRNRTCNPQLRRLLLYPLSYGANQRTGVGDQVPECQGRQNWPLI